LLSIDSNQGRDFVTLPTCRGKGSGMVVVGLGIGIGIRYLKLGQTAFMPQNNDSRRENDVENRK
jgi:hypothetical protein